MIIAVIVVKTMCIVSEKLFGGKIPNIASLITPPRIPVTVARIIMPTISYLCSIALRAPVTAKAAVPNKSSTNIIMEKLVSKLNN
jgi:hypothetical protein